MLKKNFWKHCSPLDKIMLILLTVILLTVAYHSRHSQQVAYSQCFYYNIAAIFFNLLINLLLSNHIILISNQRIMSYKFTLTR